LIESDDSKDSESSGQEESEILVDVSPEQEEKPKKRSEKRKSVSKIQDGNLPKIDLAMTKKIRGPGKASPRDQFRSATPRTQSLVQALDRTKASSKSSVPQRFPEMLAQEGVKPTEVAVLRVMLVIQPYSWVDAFIESDGLKNLVNLIKTNALHMRGHDEIELQSEALNCYKILSKVRMKELSEVPDFAKAIAFTLLPSVAPKVRLKALKILLTIANFKEQGRKSVLKSLNSLHKHLTRRNAKTEGDLLDSPIPLTSILATYRRCFRILIQLLGNSKEQDSEIFCKSYGQEDSAKPTSVKTIKARQKLRLNALRLIHTLVNATESVSGRLAIRRELQALGSKKKMLLLIQDDMIGTFKKEAAMLVEEFQENTESDIQEMEALVQKKSQEKKQPKRRKGSFSIGSWGKKNENERKEGSRLSASIDPKHASSLQLTKKASSLATIDDLDLTDTDEDLSSFISDTSDDGSDDEGTEGTPRSVTSAENVVHVTVITEGLQRAGPESKAVYDFLVPFTEETLVEEVIQRVESQCKDNVLSKFSWGLFTTPCDDHPETWLNPRKTIVSYGLKGQVETEYKLQPWILKITCRATDVINTLTITKMRFDPHRSCADAVASVRARFPHLSAWDEYDWGLYWHTGYTGESSFTQVSQEAVVSKEKEKEKKKEKKKSKIQKSKKGKGKGKEKVDEKKAESEESPTSTSTTNGCWLNDTTKLASYPELYQTEDIIELKMKMMGIQVKIFSQEAAEFMQFYPNKRIETCLKEIAQKISSDDWTNYGLYLEHAQPSTGEHVPGEWLDTNKKLYHFKFGPEDCLRFLKKEKQIMVVVYSDNTSDTENIDKYATFSRRVRPPSQAVPIYRHFPIDFMASLPEVKQIICSKVRVVPEEYILYHKKSPTVIAEFTSDESLFQQNVDAYARLLLVKKGLVSSSEELLQLVGTADKEREDEEEDNEEAAKVMFEEDDPKKVKCGSIRSLTNYLILTPYYDPDYTEAFVFTHHAFVPSEMVLRILTKQYELASEPFEELSAENSQPETKIVNEKSSSETEIDETEDAFVFIDNEPDSAEKRARIKRRILFFIQKWVDIAFDDFHDQVLEKLIDFLNQSLVNDPTDSPAAIQKILDKVESKTTAVNDPKMIIPKTMLEKISWLEIDEVELARQLSLKTSEIFSEIKSSEFFGQCWAKESTQEMAPNLINLINYFNIISKTASTVILKQEKIHGRAKVFTKLILIAGELRKLGNFHLVQALVAGFSNSAVSRLQWTKAKLSKQAKQTLQEVEELMSMDSSFKKYRSALENTEPPAIPYIGVCLQDLTFIEDGNPSHMHGNLINFSKHQMVYNVISMLHKYQQKTYSFEKNPHIMSAIESEEVMDDAALYSLSLQEEPRNSRRVDIK